MSYQEKRTGTQLLTGLLVLVMYCIYTFGQYQTGTVAPDDLKFWATNMLIFIGIGIGLSIVVQIIFHIMLSISIAVEKTIKNEPHNDKDIERTIGAEMVEDERDKLIELKSMRIGFIVAGIGFVVALVSLILNYPPMVMLNILFISFSTGSLFEGIGQFYYYRKGV